MGRRSPRFPGERGRARDLDEGFGSIAVAVAVAVAVVLAVLGPTALILDDAAGRASTAHHRLTARQRPLVRLGRLRLLDSFSRAVVSMSVTPSGGGYRLMTSGGGAFAFGNAQIHRQNLVTGPSRRALAVR